MSVAPLRAVVSTTGTFLVTHAEHQSAVLRDVETAQVHTLSGNPGLAPDDVVVGELTEGPAGVTWSLASEDERWTVAIEAAEERPVDAAYDALAGRDAGTMVALVGDDPDGTGGDPEKEPPAALAGALAVHAVAVPVADTADAVADLVADDATRVRAARLGARRVTVRGADGVVTVRYLGAD